MSGHPWDGIVIVRVHSIQRRSHLMTRITCLWYLILHLERQMYAVIFEIMLFSVMYESLNALTFSISRMSRTLVDINIRVLSWLIVAFSGYKGCLRLLRAQPDPRQLRDDGNFKRGKILEVVIARFCSGRSTCTYDTNEYLEKPFESVS